MIQRYVPPIRRRPQVAVIPPQPPAPPPPVEEQEARIAKELLREQAT
jgi:hypothetical protein